MPLGLKADWPKSNKIILLRVIYTTQPDTFRQIFKCYNQREVFNILVVVEVVGELTQLTWEALCNNLFFRKRLCFYLLLAGASKLKTSIVF